MKCTFKGLMVCQLEWRARLGNAVVHICIGVTSLDELAACDAVKFSKDRRAAGDAIEP